MMKAATACLVALLAIVLEVPGRPAGAAEPESAAPAACVAARDKALGTLDEAALAVETAIDSDVAIAGSPEYELLQTKNEQIEEIKRERRDVWERFRRCAGKESPAPAR
jgi:hypothetical protein